MLQLKILNSYKGLGALSDSLLLPVSLPVSSLDFFGSICGLACC